MASSAVAAGHGAGCGLKRVAAVGDVGGLQVAAGHGAGCGLKRQGDGEGPRRHPGCSRSWGRLWIETLEAGAGVRHLALQPVMGPAVD